MNSQDAKTPRTDYRSFYRDASQEYVTAEFARELERELAHDAAQTATLEREVAELRKDRERLDWMDKRGMGDTPRAWTIFEYALDIRAAIDAAKK